MQAAIHRWQYERRQTWTELGRIIVLSIYRWLQFQSGIIFIRLE